MSSWILDTFFTRSIYNSHRNRCNSITENQHKQDIPSLEVKIATRSRYVNGRVSAINPFRTVIGPYKRVSEDKCPTVYKPWCNTISL